MGYTHFRLAAYFVVRYLADCSMESLAADYESMARHLALDRVYLETYRAGLTIEAEKMRRIKEFFLEKGLEVAGGLTATGAPGSFPPGTLCYTSEAGRG